MAVTKNLVKLVVWTEFFLFFLLRTYDGYSLTEAPSSLCIHLHFTVLCPVRLRLKDLCNGAEFLLQTVGVASLLPKLEPRDSLHVIISAIH